MPNHIRVTRHAHDRWLQRLGGSLWAEHPIGKAWREGVTVDAPEVDCDEARVYELPIGHEDMLLVGRREEGELVLVTVLYADHRRLDPLQEVRRPA